LTQDQRSVGLLCQADKDLLERKRRSQPSSRASSMCSCRCRTMSERILCVDSFEHGTLGGEGLSGFVLGGVVLDDLGLRHGRIC